MPAGKRRPYAAKRQSSTDSPHFEPKSVTGAGNRPRLPVMGRTGQRFEAIARKHVMQQHFHHHHCEMQPQAHVRAAAERHLRVPVTASDLIGRETHRIESGRLGPQRGIGMDGRRTDQHERACRDSQACESDIAQGSSRQHRNRRHDSQGFAQGEVGQPPP